MKLGKVLMYGVIGFAALVVIGNALRPPTAQEVVDDAIEAGSIKPVLERCAEVDDNKRLQVSYEISKEFCDRVAKNIDKCADSQNNKISKALKDLPSNDPKLDYLGALSILKHNFESMYSINKELDSIEKELERCGLGSNVDYLDPDQVVRRSFYIASQEIGGDKQVYAITGHNRIANYGYSEYFDTVYERDATYVSNLDTEGYLETYNKGLFYGEGLYSMYVMPTGTRKTITINGFEREVPVYMYVSDEAYRYLHPLRQWRQFVEARKKALKNTAELCDLLINNYGKKPYSHEYVSVLTNGLDLNISTADIEKRNDLQSQNEYRGQKLYRLNDGADIRFDAERLTCNSVSFNHEDIQNSKGVKIGDSKAEVKAKMGADYYLYDEERGLEYLLPNGQIISYIFYGNSDALKEIEYSRYEGKIW